MQKHLSPKKLKKIIATILVFVMVFQFVPNIAIAVNINAVINKMEAKVDMPKSLDEHLEKQAKEQEKAEPVIIGELEEERTYTEKHFLRSDGSVVASVFPSNVHYEKDGKFLDVDNTLEEVIDTEEKLKITEENTKIEMMQNNQIEEKLNKAIIEEQKKETKIYKNKTGNAQIYFTNKTNGYRLGSMESEGYTIKWGLVNSQPSKVNVNSKNLEKREVKGLRAKEVTTQIPTTSIEYNEVLSNISIEYSAEPEHVKENIILQNKEAINNELKFVYDVGTLEMKLLETKDIIVYDKIEENIKFTIEAPFMYDNKLEFSSDIDIKLEKQEGKYIITLIPDKKWLEAEERIYPITIDPSIITSRYYDDIKDTFIYSSQGSDPKGNAHIIRAGNNSGVPTRSLVKFNLPELKAGDQVIGAYLNIFTYPKTSEWTPNTRQIQLDAHKITADWNENTATWSNTNANYNSRAEDFILYQFDYNNQCKQYTFNITTAAKEWYTTGNNYGVMIKEHSEANNVSGNDAYFISSDTNVTWYEGRPVVQIIYRNQTGLEDYLSYHTQDLGRAGTVYTNDYNGNLVWIHNDISTPGERFPVTITHVYNTNDKDVDSRYGNGMRLNLSQTIELLTIGGTEYAEYIDEDGTRHYFTKEGNIYKDEDGLNLELTLDAGTAVFSMKDKGDNVIRFERRTVAGRYLWHLKEIEDNNGNKIIITFSEAEANDFIISKVTDGAGQEITFEYTGNYLSKLTGPDGKSIQFICYNDGTLGEIKYLDNRESMLVYQNNLLVMLLNIDVKHLNFEYYPEKTNRVKTIEERASNLALGNRLTIAYNDNLTTFTDYKGFSNNVTFNDWGQAISVADFGKDGIDLGQAYGKVYNYGESGGAKNRLTLDGSLTKSVNNLVFNGSFEYDGEWEFRNWGNNPGSVEYSTEDKYTGSRSMKISSIFTESVQPAAYHYCNAEKGKTYTLSLQSKLERSSVGEGYIQLYYLDASGNRVMEEQDIIEKNSEWNKYSLSLFYPEDATSSLTVVIGFFGNKGTIYYDDIQVEEGFIANQYNIIENSDFSYPGNNTKSWIKHNTNSIWDSAATIQNHSLFRLYGDATVRKNVHQDIVIGGKAGDVFSISAWVYAGGTRNRGETVTYLTVNVVGKNNEPDWTSYACYPSEQWQFVQQEFIAPHDYKKIEVSFCFYENVNEAYITNVALYKDHFGQSYQYDSNGNLIKAQDLAKQNNTFNYDGNDNLIKYTNPEGGTFEYQYDTTYKHRLTKAISSTGVNYNFTYNQYGQATTSKITNNTNSKYIETNAEYTENGNYLTKIKDETGKETTYEYNQTNGNLDKVTDAKGTETNYTYDELGRISIVSKTVGNKTYQNRYTYENDRINTIAHNRFNYYFTYDEYGNRKQVKIANQTLITNNYDENYGNLNSVIYGNDDTISYTYDRFNIMTTQTKEQGTYKYKYDAQSNLAYIETPEGIKEYYTYDLSGRITNVYNALYGFKRAYKYDKNNNLNYSEYVFNGNISRENYGYDNQNRITSVSTYSGDSNSGNSISMEFDYDNLSRLSRKFISGANKSYIIRYDYENVDSNRTTSRVSSIEGDSFFIGYNYDELGNIKNVRGRQSATYYYDSLNQLKRENNETLSKTITYEYDLGGNITNKTEYPYTTGELGTATKTINYTYGNTNWKDQLTSYNGQTITYDTIGNPLSYNGNTYTWQNGRELKSITNENTGLNISYKYNDEGIRTEKTVNGVTTEYFLEGTKVIYEKKDNSNSVIYYFYDNNGDIMGLRYNGAIYLYLKNLQGDIIGILDNNKNHIVSYTYDSWGKMVSIKDEEGKEITDPNHVGIANPYRYRSYRYDTETGLYYLNSRYYNPEWGRFLNADGTFNGGNEIIGHNLFAYCSNNPINYYDPLGSVSILSIIKNIKNLISKEIQKLSAPIIATNMAKNAIKISAISNNSAYTRKNIRFAEDLSTKGKPNSTEDLLNPDGTIKKRRYYGPDGKATRDTDYNHTDDGTHKFPHNHDWEWDGDKCKRGPAYNFRNLGKGIGIGVGGYVLYRGIRMIPSLFPALWWTIPANAATP